MISDRGRKNKMQNFVKAALALAEKFCLQCDRSPAPQEGHEVPAERKEVVTSNGIEGGPFYCAATTLHRFNVHYHCMTHVKCPLQRVAAHPKPMKIMMAT